MFQGIRVPTWKKKTTDQNNKNNENDTKKQQRNKDECDCYKKYPPRVAPGWDTSGSTCVKGYFGNWVWSIMSNNHSLTDQSSEADKKKATYQKAGSSRRSPCPTSGPATWKALKHFCLPRHLHLHPLRFFLYNFLLLSTFALFVSPSIFLYNFLPLFWCFVCSSFCPISRQSSFKYIQNLFFCLLPP